MRLFYSCANTIALVRAYIKFTTGYQVILLDEIRYIIFMLGETDLLLL